MILAAIQVLRNAIGSGTVPDVPEKTVMKMYLRGGGWVSNFPKKNRYVTLECDGVMIFTWFILARWFKVMGLIVK